MIYSDFQGIKLSLLGFGTMRLPLLPGGGDGDIDEAQVQAMTDYAMEHGVNYFDTAYPYHASRSELVIGRALARYPRESYYLADKFPGHQISETYDPEAVFEDQLRKCGVDYFDFYLLHNVCENSLPTYLDPRWGIIEYFVEQKRRGRIRHLGFSSHGRLENLREFLDLHGEQMEFCQIQLNYVDWTLQQGKEKCALLGERNIPVWVMEPLRGGSLAKINEEAAKKLEALRPEESIPAWAFRFLQSMPEVKVTLSGMSNAQQLIENIATFEEDKPLNKEEMDTLLGIADDMVKKIVLPCTACHYCVSHCPQELDIPRILELYNEHCFTGGGFIAPMVVSTLPEDKRPSACIGCRSCEAVCPQQIKVSEIMADFAERTKPNA